MAVWQRTHRGLVLLACCIAVSGAAAAQPAAAAPGAASGPSLPCTFPAADGAIALSTRPECRDETLQAVRAAVHTLNATAATPSPPRRQRRAESAGIRTTPLHRLAPLPGRYYGQRSVEQ
jgi:hypothetical protein